MTFPPGIQEIDAWNEELEEEDGGGGLPTGWTQDDSDPANVGTNGGTLSSDDGTKFAIVAPGSVAMQDNDNDGFITIRTDRGVLSGPDQSDDSVPCFEANGINGATVALDAGGLVINNVAELASGDSLIIACDSLAFYGGSPVPPPVVPVTTPDVQDVIDALVALGLVSQSD